VSSDRGGFRKSSFSNTGNCVEVAIHNSSRVAIRDSKSPGGKVLHFSASEWKAFLAGVRNGEFEIPE
jgi:hypothetical protein